MAKKINAIVKLQLPAGKATPGPPVGSSLGPHGINIAGFTKEFNEKTANQAGLIIPVVITIYADRSFDFVLKTPPAAFLLKKVAGITKASKKGANEIVATISKEDLRKIAETKMPDLNAYTIEDAMKIIEGTARNMGIAVKGVNDTELAEQAKEAAIEEREEAKREAELEKMEESAANANAEVEVIGESNKEEE